MAILRSDGDQKPSSGLGIEKQRLKFRADGSFVADQVLGKFAVVVQAAGNVAGADALQSAGENWNLLAENSQGDLAGERHLAGVPDQAKAGNIGHGVDAEFALLNDLR